MPEHNKIKEGDAVILHHKDLGFILGWALEDSKGLGESALFRLQVNSPKLPSISEVVINTNMWDVYPKDDVRVLELIRDEFVKPEYSR